jgi:hypothetical protein
MQTRKAELVLTPLEAAQAAPLAPAAAPSPTDSPSLTERWWFWTAIGVIVASAAVSAVVFATNDSSSNNAGTTGITLHSQ